MIPVSATTPSTRQALAKPAAQPAARPAIASDRLSLRSRTARDGQSPATWGGKLEGVAKSAGAGAAVCGVIVLGLSGALPLALGAAAIGAGLGAVAAAIAEI